MTAPFSEDEVALFKKDGCLLSPTFLTDEEKQKVIQWCAEIQAWEEAPDKMLYFEQSNGERLLCRTERFIEAIPELEELVRGKIAEGVAQLFGEPANIFKEKINYKLPGGGGFGAHQDTPAYMHFCQTHFTCMIAVDAMTPENGCLEVMKGYHNNGLYFHNAAGVMDEPEVLAWDDQGLWEAVPASPGDVLFFSSHLPHRSGPNTSDISRRAYYLTYNAASEGDFRDAYFDDKMEKFPPQAARIPGKDYSAGGSIYNLAVPVPSVTGDAPLAATED